jgi:cytochrome c-type biogenesis protein CcmH/NrfG
LWPDDPKGFFFLTKMYVTNGEYPKAMETLRQAYRLSPESTGDLTELSDMLFEKKAYMEAAKAYRLLLDSGKETAGIHKKLGRVSLATGDLKQAKYEFEKALSIAPDDEEIKNALGEL